MRRITHRRARVVAVCATSLILTAGPTIASRADTPAGYDGPLALGALAVPGTPPPVLPALATTAPVPTTTGATATVGPLVAAKGLGSSVSVQVVDVATGAVLLGRTPTRAGIPASTAKILTAAAALATLGPDATLTTTAVSGATPNQLVLVGGGDVLLAAGRGDLSAVIGHAGLGDLAAQVATALAAQGITSVTLAVDDTLFSASGPAPWPRADYAGGFVAPVQALAVDSGNARPGRRTAPGHPFPRVADPALTAARYFSGELAAQGVTVTGKVARATAPPSGTVLGKVESAAVADLVEQALTDSDNTVAEALARLVAVRAGKPATFAGGGAAVLDAVAALGIATAGQTMAGGSGLGKGYALTPATLVAVLRAAASSDHPELRAVLTGLPVAGGSGTLLDRFDASGQKAALGTLRAKTGTLTGTSSLAGTVVDADGRLLAFAVLADKVPSTDGARTALDALGAALASCGCG